MTDGVSDKDWTTLLLLSILLGSLGVDHFYTGKIGTGVLKLITLGGCYIWWIIDLVSVIQENFVDSDGNRVMKS
jgi:TM2 domain-containing membrane protein YozV